MVSILVSFLWIAPVQTQQLKQKAEYGGLDVPGWRAKMLKYQLSSALPPPFFPLSEKPDPKAIPVLTALLRDRDPYIRCFSLSCLGVLHEKAEPGVVPIAATLEDKEEMVRYAAAATLAEIGTPAKPAARKLVRLFDTSDKGMQFIYAVALLAIGEEQERAKKAVLTFSTKPGNRFNYQNGLAILGKRAASSQFILDIFQELVGNRNNAPKLRDDALECLGQCREPTKEIRQIVEPALRDDSPRMRVTAGWTHWKLYRKSQVVLPILLEILRSPIAGPGDRLGSISLLQSMGKAALPAIADLERVAKNDREGAVRQAAQNAIKDIRKALR